MKHRLGVEVIEEAVATGVEEHDGDFVLVVEPAPDPELGSTSSSPALEENPKHPVP